MALWLSRDMPCSFTQMHAGVTVLSTAPQYRIGVGRDNMASHLDLVRCVGWYYCGIPLGSGMVGGIGQLGVLLRPC